MSTTVHPEDVSEDLCGILVDVLSSVLPEEAEPTGQELPAGPLAVARLAIHSRGDDYWMIEIRMAVELAESIAARMFSIDAPEEDDVVDAVAEVANIAGGNVKTLVCQHARLSLPVSKIVEQLPQWTLDATHGTAYVRAVMLGHVAQLAVVPEAETTGFLWPPTDPDDDPDPLGRPQ